MEDLALKHELKMIFRNFVIDYNQMEGNIFHYQVHTETEVFRKLYYSRLAVAFKVFFLPFFILSVETAV